MSITTAAAATMRKRKRRLDLTIQRNMAQDLLAQLLPNPKLGAVQLRRSDSHHLGTGGWTLRQYRQVTLDVIDTDVSSNKGEGFGIRVHPGFAIQVVEHGSVGNNLAQLSLNLRVTYRGRLDAEALGCLLSQYHAVEVRSPHTLDPGGWVTRGAC